MFFLWLLAWIFLFDTPMKHTINRSNSIKEWDKVFKIGPSKICG